MSVASFCPRRARYPLPVTWKEEGESKPLLEEPLLKEPLRPNEPSPPPSPRETPACPIPSAPLANALSGAMALASVRIKISTASKRDAQAPRDSQGVRCACRTSRNRLSSSCSSRGSSAARRRSASTRRCKSTPRTEPATCSASVSTIARV